MAAGLEDGLLPSDLYDEKVEAMYANKFSKMDDTAFNKLLMDAVNHPEYESYCTGIRTEHHLNEDAWTFGEEEPLCDMVGLHVWSFCRQNLRDRLAMGMGNPPHMSALAAAAAPAVGATTGMVPTAPIAPAKVEPTPIAPAKVEPTPIAPALVEPTPVAPAKVEPTPPAPAKVEPTPIAPAKVEPTPIAPAKVEPTPIAPAKVEPTPVAPAKVVPTPPAPALVEPTPVAPAKVVPTPPAPALVEPTPVAPAKVVPTPPAPAMVAFTASAPAKVEPTPPAPAKVAFTASAPAKVAPTPTPIAPTVPSPAELSQRVTDVANKVKADNGPTSVTHRSEYMAFLRAAKNPGKMTKTLVPLFSGNQSDRLDLFRMWLEKGKDFAQVEIEVTRRNTHSQTAKQKDVCMSKSQLEADPRYSNEDVADLIRRKTQLGQYIDDPNFPGREDLRQYIINAETSAEAARSREDVTNVSSTVSVTATEALTLTEPGSDLAMDNYPVITDFVTAGGGGGSHPELPVDPPQTKGNGKGKGKGRGKPRPKPKAAAAVGGDQDGEPQQEDPDKPPTPLAKAIALKTKVFLDFQMDA